MLSSYYFHNLSIEEEKLSYKLSIILRGELTHQLLFRPHFVFSKVDKLPGVNGFAKLCNNDDKLLPPAETHQSVNI